jgi:hypothetical protein
MRGTIGVRALPLVGVTLALAVTGTGTASAADGGSRPAEQTLLRLTDLPGGYLLRPGGYCEPLEVHSYTGKRALEAWGKAFSPFDCHLGYKRLYRPPGAAASPPTIATAAVTTASVEGAVAAASVGEELVENLTGAREVRAAATPTVIGDETHLFRSPEFDGEGGSQPQPGVSVVWRVGGDLQVVYAGGWSYAKDELAAYALAAKQQAHVEAPAPFLASEAEDIPTYFENPRLGVPAYWLGKEFKTGSGPTSYFLGAYPRGYFRLAPGQRMTAQYNTELFLDSWTPAGWRRFAKTEVGRRQWSWHCTRSRTIELEEGHAVIYGSYKSGYATCPTSGPHHFIAHVFLPGVVIAIGEPPCRYCQGDLDPNFESFKAVEKIVRGLRRWRPS